MRWRITTWDRSSLQREVGSQVLNEDQRCVKVASNQREWGENGLIVMHQGIALIFELLLELPQCNE